MNVEGLCPGSEARAELDHGQPSPPESTKVNTTIGELSSVLTFSHSGDEGELWASAKLDEDMHDGRA
eukprot:5432905-Prymnesium_polylepis.1